MIYILKFSVALLEGRKMNDEGMSTLNTYVQVQGKSTAMKLDCQGGICESFLMLFVC